MDRIVKQICAPCATIRSINNKLYTINFVIKALSKMDRKRFWLNHNGSVGYENPMINQLRNEDND